MSSLNFPKPESSDSVNLQLLDLVPPPAVADKNRDFENFTAGVQEAQGVLGIGPRCQGTDLERAWRGIVKEGLENLLRLILAGIVGGGHDRYLKIVIEPGGQPLGVTVAQLLRYRLKHVITVSDGSAAEQGQHHGQGREYLSKDLHSGIVCYKFRATSLKHFGIFE